MQRYRADFEVKASIVLRDKTPSLSLRAHDGQTEIVLRNSKQDEHGHVPHLLATVVGPAESLEIAPYAHRETLADHLDLVAYVTHNKFEVLQCRRVLDWEPYQKTRHFMMMAQFDADYPPHPDLPPECIDTVNAIAAAGPADHARRALHYFRLGTLSRSEVDQFHQFWLALETVAEGLKKTEPVPVECPKCRGPLKCAVCQIEPTRRPMAVQAIRELLRSMNPKIADETLRRLNVVRSGLVHGRSPESIERKLGRSLTDLVNEAANAAWHAIARVMPTITGRHHFMHRGGRFENRVLIAGPVGAFDCLDGQEHPSDDQIPDIKTTMTFQFRENPPSQGDQ